VSIATGSPVRLDWSGRAAETWSWLPESEIEAETLAQVHDVGSLESAARVAVMPDAHKGYGMPIGCMLATVGTVVPYAVGVDIGCGMIAARTTLSSVGIDQARVREALEGVYRRVPVGLPARRDSRQGSHRDRQNSQALREWASEPGMTGAQVKTIRERADHQLGTLGSGNHFVELQADDTGQLWFMLHTGSRSFGKQLCDHWHLTALASCASRGATLPSRELAYLELESDDGRGYLRDMTYAMRFAEDSRRRIYDRVVEALTETFGAFEVTLGVETHHNFAAIERHEGRDVVVHRKGAVRTTTASGEGALVTIPGSMQTGSYIGRGHASERAYDTCAHGAGRKLGRSAVRAAAVGVDIRTEMAAEGIVLVCPPDADVLDESKRAYKDIEDVMHRQRDLVEPVVKLRPLGVTKG
jgi:tRNA-splicing ligase RtcB